MIADRRPCVPLSIHSTVHAKYVDNFFVVGHDPPEVGKETNGLTNFANVTNLKVHESSGLNNNCIFGGLELDRDRRTAHISHRRMWRLKFDIDHILQCKFLFSRALEVVVGHLTWACLVRREALCVLASVHLFIHSGFSHEPLWDTVRKEHHWARSLLPLFEARLDNAWSPICTSTDSSPQGFGVCDTILNENITGQIGRQSERWRCLVQDGLGSFDSSKAREHALRHLDDFNQLEFSAEDSPVARVCPRPPRPSAVKASRRSRISCWKGAFGQPSKVADGISRKTFSELRGGLWCGRLSVLRTIVIAFSY